MSDFWSEERITDYLDDRLSQPERELVEAHLQENPGDAETLLEFQQMREALRGAKTFQLDDGFSQRVLQSIQQLPQAVNVTATTSPTVERSLESSIKSRGLLTHWRYTAGMIAALAATLLVALFLIPWNRTPVNTARMNKNELAAAGENTAGDLEKDPDNAAGGFIPAESADTRDGPSNQDTRDSLAQSGMEQAKPPSRDSFSDQTSETDNINDTDESESFKKEARARKAGSDDDMVEGEEGQSEPNLTAPNPTARSRAPNVRNESHASGDKALEEKSDSENMEEKGTGSSDSADQKNVRSMRVDDESVESPPLQFNGAELVVVTSSSRNLSTIDSLDQEYRESPAAPKRQDYLPKNQDINDLDRVRQRGRESDKAGAGGNTNRDRSDGHAGLDDKLKQDVPSQPSVLNENSLVFEVDATEAELAEILQQIKANRLALNDVDQLSLVESVSGLVESAADGDASGGVFRQYQRPGKSRRSQMESGAAAQKDTGSDGPRIRRLNQFADSQQQYKKETEPGSKVKDLQPDQMGVDSNNKPADELVAGRRSRAKTKKGRPAGVMEQQIGGNSQQSQSQESTGRGQQAGQAAAPADAQAADEIELQSRQDALPRRRYLLVINLVPEGEMETADGDATRAEKANPGPPRSRSNDKK